MFLLLLLFAAALVAPSASPSEPLVVPVSAPPGHSLPVSVEIHWFADGAHPGFETEELTVQRGRLYLTPPPHAERFIVLGSGLSSRNTSLEEARRSGIHLLPGGTVVLEATSPIREVIRVWITDESGAVRERSFNPPPRGGRTVQFVLPFGRYGIGVDQGPDKPLIYLVRLVSGYFLTEEKLPGPGGEPVTIAVRDRSTGVPLEGACVSSLDREPLGAILRARVPPTGADGLLRFGRIDPRLLLNLQVDMQDRRSVELRDKSSEDGVRREVLLPPNQSVEVKVKGLSPARLASKPAISIGLCRNLNSRIACRPEDWVSAEINAEGNALFPFVPPGRYLLKPNPAAQNDEVRTVNSSARVSDPDVVTAWFDLQEYAYRGRVRFADGRPAEADVRATAMSRRSGDGEELSRTRSWGDGSFELCFVTTRTPIVWAASDDSSARGDLRGYRKDEEGSLSGEILLSETALQLTLRDQSTRQPLPDCSIQVLWEESGTREGPFMRLGGVSSLEGDSAGRATFNRFRGGKVKVLPSCAGYARTAGFDFTVAAEEKREEELLLEKTSDFTLRVVDVSGDPIEGARVLAHPADQSICSMGDCYHTLGPNKGREEVLVSGRDWSGVPLYILAPGRRLFVGRFAPRVCEVQTDCAYAVTPSAPSVFPGLAVRTPAGSVLERLIFSLDGVAVPRTILSEATTAIRVPAEQDRQEGGTYVSYLPRVLPDGEYEVSAYVRDPSDNRSGRSVSLGVLRLPAAKRVTLLVPDPETAPGD